MHANNCVCAHVANFMSIFTYTMGWQPFCHEMPFFTFLFDHCAIHPNYIDYDLYNII